MVRPRHRCLSHSNQTAKFAAILSACPAPGLRCALAIAEKFIIAAPVHLLNIIKTQKAPQTPKTPKVGLPPATQGFLKQILAICALLTVPKTWPRCQMGECLRPSL